MTKALRDTIRVWVPGCATGEEAYSIAILLLKEASRHEIRCGLRSLCFRSMAP